MVGEIGVHDNDKVARGELEAMDVGSSKTELAGARLEDDAVCAIDGDELLCDLLGAVGGAVVDDDYFPLELAGEGLALRGAGGAGDALLGEGLFNEPGYDGEVLALVVGREDDRVFVFCCWCHCCGCIFVKDWKAY